MSDFTTRRSLDLTSSTTILPASLWRCEERGARWVLTSFPVGCFLPRGEWREAADRQGHTTLAAVSIYGKLESLALVILSARTLDARPCLVSRRQRLQHQNTWVQSYELQCQVKPEAICIKNSAACSRGGFFGHSSPLILGKEELPFGRLWRIHNTSLISDLQASPFSILLLSSATPSRLYPTFPLIHHGSPTCFSRPGLQRISACFASGTFAYSAGS
jgi:hypothetical protein